MRVAMFHATLPQAGRKLGGVEVAVHRLANALVEHAGCDVTVFSCDAEPADARYRHVRIPRHAMAEGKLGRLAVLPVQLNFIDFSGFDVLHLHGDDWFFARRRLPSVRTLHGSALFEARFAASWRRKLVQSVVYPLEHLSARLASVSVAVGTEATALYRAAGLVDNGVDASVFRPRAKDPDPLVFYVGTWNGRKRGSFAYETFLRHVLPRWPAARLFMACDQVPQHPQVIDGGFPPQDVLADWMARAWVFLYPSVYEGFGIPYVEALASGTAIVTSRNSGADYVLQRGRFGRVASDAEIGPALSRLLADGEARAELERRGLRHAERYHWSNVSREHVRVYETAITSFRA